VKKVIVSVFWKPSKQFNFYKTNVAFHYKNDILIVKHDGNSVWLNMDVFLTFYR